MKAKTLKRFYTQTNGYSVFLKNDTENTSDFKNDHVVEVKTTKANLIKAISMIEDFEIETFELKKWKKTDLLTVAENYNLLHSK